MEDYNKRNMIIVTSFLALLSFLGLTYAYFTATISGGETATTITVGGGTMNINYASGSSIIIYNIMPQNNPVASKTFTVTGNNTTDLMMPYELSLIVDENTFSNDAISYTLMSTNTSGSGTAINSVVSPKGLNSGTGTYQLGLGSFIKGNNKIHTYILNIYFLETSNDQNANQGKNFKAHIIVQNGEEKSNFSTPEYLNDYIKSLSDASEATGVYLEDGVDYRYEGKTPNNYVTFNNELWRIIGVFAQNTHLVEGENLIKIIRDEAFENFNWNDTSNNDWASSAAYRKLHTYFNEEISEISRQMVREVSWQHNSIYYMDEKPSNIYNFERSEYQVTKGYIGSMYVSDFGYAVTANDCNRDTLLKNYFETTCTYKSWLKPVSGTLWTMVQYPLYGYMAWTIDEAGNIGTSNVQEAHNNAAAVYLKEEVKVISGTGEITNPYKIEL